MMEIDGTSSGSSDSHIGNFCHPGGNINYYSDNLYFATNCKLDSYFAGDKLVKKIDSVPKKIEYFRKDDYSNGVNGKSVLNKSDAGGKRVLSYAECFEKKTEDRRVQLDFYSNGGTVTAKNEGTIQLNGIDSYGKKSMSFSPDQVYFYSFFLNIFVYSS